MESGIKSRKIFTALMTAFAFHNAEEAYMICRFPFENPFKFVHPLTCHQFLIAVSFLTISALVIYWFAMRAKNPEVYLWISSGLAAILLFNVLVPHLLVGVYTSNYTPGLITAVLLILPLSILLLVQNKKLYTTKKQMIIHIISSLAIGYIWFAITLGFTKLL
jgi:hypothetical protein